jgi:hypothetical protein
MKNIPSDMLSPLQSDLQTDIDTPHINKWRIEIRENRERERREGEKK